MHLRTFGGLSIEAGPGETPSPSIGPRRLALLAIVAAAGPRGVTREKVVGILWPESDEELARHTLSQSLYSLRRDSGQSWIRGTAQLQLDAAMASDVGEFLLALNTDQPERAAAAFTGPFLEGFYLGGAPEFERWVEETRARLQHAAQKALETLARQADDAGAHDKAAQWWRRLCEIDPLHTTWAAGRVRSLIANGDLGAALRAASEHQARVRHELETEPDPSIGELIAGIRASAEPAATSLVTESVPAARPVPSIGARPRNAPSPRNRPLWMVAASIAMVMLAAVIGWRISAAAAPSTMPPFLAVGTIASRDSAALAPVLRDMLATNLARVSGIQVVSNSRLLELLPDSPVAGRLEADAARRAGAREILEGELGTAGTELVLTLRRVNLRSGLVDQGYTVRAANLFALTDSATATIAADFQLDPPPDAVATVRTRSAVAYALYEQGLRAYYQSDFPATARLMTAALSRDSTFAMAAFYAWRSYHAMSSLEEANRLLPVARRLATRTVDRERLLIEGTLAQAGAPLHQLLAIAREMSERYPGDPDGLILLGQALQTSGDWAGSVAALNRAIAIDSAAGARSGPQCRVCVALYHIGLAYSWWDSAGAAEGSAHRQAWLREEGEPGWEGALEAMLRQGRRTEAEAAIARMDRARPLRHEYRFQLDRDLIRSGRLGEVEARLVSALRTSAPSARGEMPWLLAIALRNQGRLREARALAADGLVPGSATRLDGPPDVVSLAIIALEAGRPREAADRFLELAEADHRSQEPPGYMARNTTWHLSLAATALAAAGDTAAVRALADSVERIGAFSSFGRDPRIQHFLRGLIFQHQNLHADAVEAFRRSLFSLTDGYTRINLHMATSLMALNRHDEAIAVLQPALRGGVDGSNTYITHTELHETLARAFDAAGQRDSASVHYAAVERAWRPADPEFATRHELARARAATLSLRN